MDCCLILILLICCSNQNNGCEHFPDHTRSRFLPGADDPCRPNSCSSTDLPLHSEHLIRSQEVEETEMNDNIDSEILI